MKQAGMMSKKHMVFRDKLGNMNNTIKVVHPVAMYLYLLLMNELIIIIVVVVVVVVVACHQIA
jgi:hypothetical protein